MTQIPAPPKAERPAAAPSPVHPPGRPTRLAPGGTNAVGITLGLVGDEWNLLILRYALLGVRRYGEWGEVLPISHAVLTRRLAGLTEMGVFQRVEYQARARRYEVNIRASAAEFCSRLG